MAEAKTKWPGADVAAGQRDHRVLLAAIMTLNEAHSLAHHVVSTARPSMATNTKRWISRR